jgi:hypothetical protein
VAENLALFSGKFSPYKKCGFFNLTLKEEKIMCKKLIIFCFTLAVVAAMSVPVLAADNKQEKQSVFGTSDGKIVTSSEFIKLLKEKLDTRYQDLEIVIKSCHSGEFVTRAAGANGIGGDWSVSTSCDKDKPATNTQTTDDKDIPQGPDANIPGLHIGGHYYHGYAAQYIKKLKEAPNTSNKDLHQTAKDKNHHPEEKPQYGSSGANADNMTVHGGKKSNHAIIFSQPASFGEELTETLYDALKGAGYADGDIDYLRDTEGGKGIVDHNATKQDLKDALDRLNEVLKLHDKEEKAYIFIDAHGGYEKEDVAYVPDHTPGVPGNGVLVSYPTGTVVIDADATLVRSLAEEAPRGTGGFWADEPALHRVAQPTLRFTTVAESFSGSADVNISLNQVPLGSFEMTGSPQGGDYRVLIPDAVLDGVLTSLRGTSNIVVQFQFINPGDSFKLATDDDFNFDPCYPYTDYGVGVYTLMDAYEVLDTNSLVVDNFESYTATGPNDPNIIYKTWTSGLGRDPCNPGNGTGSRIGLPNPPYVEQYIVYDGSQSMPYFYDNTFNYGEGYYSEAKADTNKLEIGSDWDRNGVKALTLYFYGDPNNDANATEQMYVALEDDVNAAVVYYDGNSNDVREPNWHEWNIRLIDFTNVDLNNVKKVYVGFGSRDNYSTPGGSGLVFFDELRLYAPRCVLSKRSADFAIVDYAPAGDPAGDCVVDYQELQIMANTWLAEDDIIDTPGGPLWVPVPSAAEIYEEEPLGFRIINFKDFAVLAEIWLEEEMWPR